MRIIASKRITATGENFYYCPVSGAKLVEPFVVDEQGIVQNDDCCGHCRIERLQSRFRIHNDQVEDDIRDFEPVKAYDTQGKYTGHNVILSPRHSYIEPKLDGVRALVHCTPSGVYITSRRRDASGRFRQFQDNVPHLRDHRLFQALGEEGYTILDGEIIMTDEGSGTLAATMSVAGSLPETAEAVQRNHGWARLVAFDIPMWEGRNIEDLRFEDRRTLLENLDLDNNEHLFTIRCHKNVAPGNERDNLLQDYLMEGYEGIVLKDPASTYRGTRAWLKLKDEVTLDVQVIGWERGRAGGKWAESLGALFCGVIDSRTGEMTEVCDVMPGDDTARARLFEALQRLTDEQILAEQMIVEIKGQCWTSDGKIRHPRIVAWRPDRSEPNTLDLSHVFGKEWQDVAISNGTA